MSSGHSNFRHRTWPSGGARLTWEDLDVDVGTSDVHGGNIMEHPNIRWVKKNEIVHKPK